MRKYLITHARAPYSKGKTIPFESGALSQTGVNVGPSWTDGTYCKFRRDRGTRLDLTWFTATYIFKIARISLRKNKLNRSKQIVFQKISMKTYVR